MSRQIANLLLEDGVSHLLLEDGSTFLLLFDIEIPDDQQWFGKIIPEVGVTQVYDIENDLYYLVTALIRYNRSPAQQYQYTCGLKQILDPTITGVGDVWYSIEDDLWYCKTYLPVRYRDEDGVKKNL
jgi:hypothetical protein